MKRSSRDAADVNRLTGSTPTWPAPSLWDLPIGVSMNVEKSPASKANFDSQTPVSSNDPNLFQERSSTSSVRVLQSLARKFVPNAVNT